MLLLLPLQVLTFVLLFLLSFSGFLVSDVPVYFRWIQKISFLTYAYAAVAGNEFLHTTYYYSATPGGDKVYVSGAAIWDGEAPPVSVAQINNGLSGALRVVGGGRLDAALRDLSVRKGASRIGSPHCAIRMCTCCARMRAVLCSGRQRGDPVWHLRVHAVSRVPGYLCAGEAEAPVNDGLPLLHSVLCFWSCTEASGEGW